MRNIGALLHHVSVVLFILLLPWGAQAQAEPSLPAPSAAEPSAGQAPSVEAPGPAPAAPAATTTAAPVEHTTVGAGRTWYGYQVLLVDAAALGAGLAVGSANEGNDWQQRGDVIATTWGLGMVGAFAVHAAHENPALGLAGMASRLLLPPMGAVLGVGVQCIAVGGERPCSAAGGRGGFVAGMLGAIALDSLAFARAEPEAPLPPSADRRIWYGYQTLVIDGAALAAGLAFTIGREHPDRSDDAARMLVFPYLVGFLVSPWVHAVHGRVGVAFGSFALRALVPALGALPGMAGYCAASGSETRCSKEGALWGIFGGALLMSAIDIGTMSFEHVSPAELEEASVTPFLLPVEHGALAGIAGRI